MTHQFTINFTEEHAKYALRKFFVRYVGVGLPIALLLICVVILQRLATREFDWIFGSLLVVFIMGTGIFVAAYFARLNQAIGQLKKMGNPIVQYELTDDKVKASSGLGSTEVKWEVFKSVWIFPKVWLLMFDKAGYLTLPADQLDEDVKNFLKQKIAAVGGTIK